MEEFSIEKAEQIVKGEAERPKGVRHAGVFIEGKGLRDLYVGMGDNSLESAVLGATVVD